MAKIKAEFRIIYIASALLLALFFCGCNMREEIGEGGELDPAHTVTSDSEEAASSLASGKSGMDITTHTISGLSDEDELKSIWEIYSEARDNTSKLYAREESQLLYTRRDAGDESISMKLVITDIGTEDVKLSATGNVKAAGKVIPLEIYYQNGIQYSASGSNVTSQSIEYEQMLKGVDVLYSLKRDLVFESISEAAMTESADGIISLSIVFDGPVNGLRTAGNGEIIINEDGLIVSEGYSFSAESDGRTVSQSVECILVSWNGDVPEIVLPEKVK